MSGDAAVAGHPLYCFLILTVLVDMDCYLFWLVAAGNGLGLAFFDEGVDGVDLAFLVEEAFC